MSKEALLSQYFEDRLALEAAWRSKRDAAAYLAGHADALDRALRSMAEEAALPADRLVLAAVGGYGRRELFPYSDIDLLVLLSEEAAEDRALGAKTADFAASRWELKLSVGAAVRTRSEFLEEARRDVSVATTYLESRPIWGDASAFLSAREALYADLDAPDFFSAKMLELSRRHQKYDDTPYALEPNVKESPGGLRDLQVFLWCAQAAGIAQSVDEMAESRLITDRERTAISRSLRFLSELRIDLHLLARRHEDRLIFDLQEPLAKRRGIEPSGDLRPSEALMKRYYLNAKTVSQMSIIQLQAISDRLLGGNERATPVRLEPAFVARGDEMDVVDDKVYEKDPNAVLRTFLVFSTHPELTRLSTRLLRALWHAGFKLDQAYRDDPKNQAVFLEIMKLPKGCYHALKMMNTWNILGRFLTPFRQIVGQMQHDLYHAFTVDQHTLRTVRNVRRFCRSDFAHEYPFCTQIMAGIPRNWRVMIAALFHDVGKGQGGRHEVIGAEKAREFCRDFELDREDEEFIVFLVREHLTMSLTAQKSDISDPAVVERFAEKVGTKERLDGLYLLTVADIRATSSKVWTQWKAQLLETLYRAAAARLAADSPQDLSLTHALEARRAEAETLLRGLHSPETLERFWREMDVVYFMRHTAQEIAWHAEVLADRMEASQPIVRAKRSDAMGGIRILFYIPDCRDLFLRAVAFFGKSGLSVVDARIHTTTRSYALDTFLVTDAYGRFAEAADLRRLEAGLAAALVSDAPLPPVPKARFSRRSKHFPTRPIVNIAPDESGRASILNIVCTDRIGLLFAVSKVLARWEVNLQTAKIATLGERCEDVFLIDGRALEHDESVLALEGELLAAIAPPELRAAMV